MCNILTFTYKGTKNISFQQLFELFSYIELTLTEHRQIWDLPLPIAINLLNVLHEGCHESEMLTVVSFDLSNV